MGETKNSIWFFLCFVLPFFASCVRLPRSFHALSYRNQTVFLDKHHHYKVGPLSDSWQVLPNPNKGPGIIFRNQANNATIATEAICGAAFEDLSLDLLTSHLLVGLKGIQRQKEEWWQLGGREALYTKALANLDGVFVQLDIVVLKKNRCQFDFLATSLPSYGDSVSEDFKTFVKGFDY